MNLKDIYWFKDQLGEVADLMADLANKKEELENAADPDGRGGLGYGWAGQYFDAAHEAITKAVNVARKLQPITQEDLDRS